MVAKEGLNLKSIFFALLAQKNQYNLNVQKMISTVQSRFSDIKFSDNL